MPEFLSTIMLKTLWKSFISAIFDKGLQIEGREAGAGGDDPCLLVGLFHWLDKGEPLLVEMDIPLSLSKLSTSKPWESAPGQEN